MVGYYHSIENQYSEGFIDTGDIGFLSENGSLTIVGRSDSMIKLNGRKCYINHIEEKILRVKSVRHVKVIKTFHDTCGEFLTAYIIPNEDIVPGNFIKELKSQLGLVLMAHEMPKLFHLLHEFQLSSNGKIQKSFHEKPL